jgi:hypothetical protein
VRTSKACAKKIRRLGPDFARRALGVRCVLASPFHYAAWSGNSSLMRREIIAACSERTSALPETIVQTREQMCNCFFGFVAHIGETKGFAPDFAVAGVDDQMMLSSQIAREF